MAVSTKELYFQIYHYFTQIWVHWLIKVPIAIAGSFYANYLGGDSILLIIFFAMVFIDLAFGVCLAIKKQNFSLKIFGKWVVKVGTHFIVILIIGIAIKSLFKPISITFPLIDLFLGMLISTEALSILKNMHKLGLPVPKVAIKILANTKNKAEKHASAFFKDDLDIDNKTINQDKKND